MNSIKKALDATTVVVVNYNSEDLVIKCLEPLRNAARLIIVDNTGSEVAVNKILASFPKAHAILNTTNFGNGMALNQGLNMSETPFTLLIDPDALLQPAELVKLYEYAITDENAAYVAPLIHEPNRDLELRVMGPGELAHSAVTIIPEGPFCSWFITGTVMFCRTEILQKLGGFDENIFLYCEDQDFCLRISAAGHGMVCLPEATAIHLGSATFGGSAKLHWRKDRNLAWSYLYITKKHFGEPVMRKEAWIMLKRHAMKALFYLIVFDKKRLIRDAAHTLGVLSFLAGQKAPRPR